MAEEEEEGKKKRGGIEGGKRGGNIPEDPHFAGFSLFSLPLDGLMEKLIAAERTYFCGCCMFWGGGLLFSFFLPSFLSGFLLYLRLFSLIYSSFPSLTAFFPTWEGGGSGAGGAIIAIIIINYYGYYYHHRFYSFFPPPPSLFSSLLLLSSRINRFFVSLAGSSNSAAGGGGGKISVFLFLFFLSRMRRLHRRPEAPRRVPGEPRPSVRPDVYLARNYLYIHNLPATSGARGGAPSRGGGCFFTQK